MGIGKRIRIDRGLLFFPILLIGIGIALQYSANYPGDQAFFYKHLIWIAISIPFGFFVFLYPLKRIKDFASLLYVIGILLLIIVLFLPNSNGRWIKLEALQFQPSELMKVFFIVFLAKFFTKFDDKKVYFPDLILPILFTAFPMILVFLEPDIGTSAIFFLIFLGMMGSLNISPLRYFLYISPFLSLLCGFNLISWIVFMILLIVALIISDLKFRHSIALFLLNIMFGAFTPILGNFLKPYQKDRLTSFLNPSWDPTGAGWHLLQSKISIGSGGFLGKGYLNGIIKNLGFLPQTRTDFIFAVLGEEFGFLGTFFVLLIFALFLWRILFVAETTDQPFGRYLGIGIFFYFLSQIAVNIGMTVGLLPVVGLPLPFLSYGGTSMFVSTIFIALLLSMRSETHA